MPVVAALLCGLIFGFGLLVSGMMQPTKVLDFLDIFGAWDPSLAVVMMAALAVSVPGFEWIKRRGQPVLTTQTSLPTCTDIDRPLVIGATMFGIGWGFVGLCPGPALENLALLSPPAIAFVAAMAAGMVLHHIWQGRRSPVQDGEMLAADG